jgi:DNA-binding transcriptional LysR family regulator
MISIKQIQNFIVLAETLHFAKAATKLNISQATLSTEIKRLEDELGFSLFDRSNKWEIKRTIAGETYYNCVKNIPTDIQKAQQEAIQSARGENGSLTVAISSNAYDYIDIGVICKKMLETYPNVKLTIIDMPLSTNRFDSLCHGKADIAIFTGSNKILLPEGFTTKSLISLDVTLAIPRKNPLASKDKIEIEDLKNINFILPPITEAPNLRKAWDEVFLKHCNSLPTVTWEVIGFKGMLQLVSANLGVGFFFTKHNEINVPDVVFKPLPITLNRSLLAGFREGTLSPVCQNFIRLLSTNI